MSTQTAATTTAPRETPMGELRQPSTGWKHARMYGGLVLIIVWGLAPFYWMVVTAFRDVDYTYDTTPWPTHVTLDNFRTAFSTDRGNHFAQALVNSVIIGILTTAVAMLVGVFTAYALSRLNFPGKYLVLGFILGASMFPGVALVAPLFSLFSTLGWLNGYNYQALIIPDISFALPLTVYTLTAFFSEMPWELEESARIDGCGPLSTLQIMVVPLVAPSMAAAAVITFFDGWNEYLFGTTFITDKENWTASTGLASFTGEFLTPLDTVFSAAFVFTIPAIIFFLLMQRRIVSGLTAGAVKG